MNFVAVGLGDFVLSTVGDIDRVGDPDNVAVELTNPALGLRVGGGVTVKVLDVVLVDVAERRNEGDGVLTRARSSEVIAVTARR